jgi:ornithine cyclodeaminase/alanine dehydrogenase-like protein (mu-crystallin family)
VSAEYRAPGEILVVSRSEVEELLTPAACLERVLDTFEWVGAGKVDQVNPVNLYVHDRSEPEPEFGHGVIQAFPAMIRPLERAAVKWLGSYRQNPRRGLPAISALDIVTDSATGMPLALVDGTSVTNMRTGAHAAVGAKFMARPDSQVVAIIGCGNEGRTHLALLNEQFALSSVVAFDINEAQLDEFEREVDEKYGLTTTRASSVEAAVAESDIVCVVTTAPEPVLMERWVQPGTHVCAATGFRDVEKACATSFDKWVVGWYGRDLEWVEGSEVGKLGGLQPGDLTKDDIHADIASELISGQCPGRESQDERTIMTHMGMPALDAAVASLVYDVAITNGVGTWIRIF